MASLLSQVALIAFIGALTGLSLWLFAQLQAYKEGLIQANMRNSLQQAKKVQQMQTLMDSNVSLRKRIALGDQALQINTVEWTRAGYAMVQKNKELQAMICLQRDTLAELQSRPLKDIRDEELPMVIRSELQQRHHDAHMAAICFYSVQEHADWQQEAHKLASKCGGAAFRVVDAIKRGKV